MDTNGVALNGKNFKKPWERLFGQKEVLNYKEIISSYFSNVKETIASHMVPCGIDIT